MKRSLLLAALAAPLLLGCDRPAADPDTAALTGPRLEAARDACIARELTAAAEDGVELLSQFETEEAAGTPTSAALVFARAAEQHARLRYAALARVDSAVNHARTPADSAGYVEAARRFLPGPPEQGTLEGNVSAAWMRDYAAIRADEDHRCHWDP